MRHPWDDGRARALAGTLGSGAPADPPDRARGVSTQGQGSGEATGGLPDAHRGVDVAAWRKLPETLDERSRQLTVQLRRLKDRSGLSLASIAAKTGYSRSSWERYLNGKAMPPRQAVEELARIAGTDLTKLLVLHEVAGQAGQYRTPVPSPSAGAQDNASPGARKATAAERPGPPPAEVTAQRPPGVRRPVLLVAVVVAALIGMGAGALLTRTWSGDEDAGAPAAAAAASGSLPGARVTPTTEGPGRYVFKPGKRYPCKVRRSPGADGGLSAGYSATRTAVLAGPGWDVVEAQCILRYRHLAPGAVDGVYGQQTIAAVMRLQKHAGLPADGVVGPHTWQVLRG